MRLSRLAKWLLGITCFVVLLVCLCAYWILQGFRVQITSCKQGPLTTISDCKIDHSTYTWMGSGWWYTHAKGPMTDENCKKMGADAKSFEIQDGSKTLHMSKVECSQAGFTNALNCFGIQWLSSNGNSRNVLLMAANDCKDSEFFSGSKAILIDGKGTHIEQWTNPYPEIPERN